MSVARPQTSFHLHPAPRGGPLDHQLFSQWSCRCSKLGARGQELRNYFDDRVRSFTREVGERYGEKYDLNCLLVFPHGLLPLATQLQEFDAVVDEELLGRCLGSSLAQPYALIGLEVVYVSKDLPTFNARFNKEGGKHLTCEEWAAALRFRKELRLLHETPDPVRGVLLETEGGTMVTYTWFSRELGHGMKASWDLLKPGLKAAQWMIPWYHHRVSLER